jgi:hypothetical protein
MSKYFFVFLFIFLMVFSVNSLSSIDHSTALVILEEKENNDFVIEATPFSDGIFNALWDKELIFFDMKIEKPIKLVLDVLDIKPYLDEAKNSGADIIVAIKFDYKLSTVKMGYKIIAKEIQYNIFSLNEMKSLRNGKKALKMDQFVESNEKKIIFLKKFGYDIMNEIFQ